MTYDEESEVAQQVLGRLADAVHPMQARGAQVAIGGVGYSVHRHGADLRFHQQTHLRRGEAGRFLIVSVGQHAGGWMIARSVRPPGGYYDERAGQRARAIVESALVQLGYDVGTAGPGGQKKTARELEDEIRGISGQVEAFRPIVSRRKRKRR